MGFVAAAGSGSDNLSPCRRCCLSVFTADNLFWAGTTLLFGPYLYVIPAFAHNTFILVFSLAMVIFGLCFWLVMYHYFVTVPTPASPPTMLWNHPQDSDLPHVVLVEEPPRYETLQSAPAPAPRSPPPSYEDLLGYSPPHRPPSYSRLFDAVTVCGVHQSQMTSDQR